MHCLLPNHALICHIMISSKLLCRISIRESVSWVPSTCTCAVSSPTTYIAKGFYSQHEGQSAPIPCKHWATPACSVHWLDSWPHPLWRKCVHLLVLWRILLWVITPRRTPYLQPTQPPKHLGLLTPFGWNQRLRLREEKARSGFRECWARSCPTWKVLHECPHKPQGEDRGQQWCKCSSYNKYFAYL